MDHRLIVAACLAASACATTAERAAYEAFDASRQNAPPPLRAEPPAEAIAPAELLGAVELAAEALKRSPALREAWYRWEAVVRGIPAARKPPEPRVSYTGFIQSVETRTGPQEHRLGVAFALPWPTQLDRAADVEAARAEVARRRYEAVRLRILRDLRVLWADLQQVVTIRAIWAEQRALLAQVADAVQARLSVGGASYAEATQVALRVRDLDERLASLDDRRHVLHARLRGAAGLPAATRIAEPEAVTDRDQPDLPDLAETGTLRDRLAGNPELSVASAAIRAELEAVERAETMRFPSFSLGVDWILVGTPETPMSADAGKDAVMAMVGISVPLWVGSYDAAASSARARAHAEEARHEAVLRDAEANLDVLLTRVEESRRRARLYGEELVPEARGALQAALTAYSADRASFSDLLGLDAQLTGYAVELAGARAGFARAVADLEWLTGQAVTP